MPDPEARKVLWAVMGVPGAVLSGVDVVGAWRTAQRGRTLQVSVEEFRPLTGPVRAALTREAERLATTRGSADVRVT